MSIATFWRDVRWQAMGNTLAQAIGILGLPVLTRLYTPADMAAQAVFLQFAMFFAGVMTLRYEYLVQLPRADQEAFSLVKWVVALAAVGTAVFTPLVLLVVALWPGSEATAGGASRWAAWLWLTPATAALISVSMAVQHLVQRLGHFKSSGMGEVAAKSGFIGFGALAALMHVGTAGILLTTGFGALAKLLVLRASNAFQWGQVLPRPSWRRTAWQPLQSVAHAHRHLSFSMVMSHLSGTVTGMAPILFISAAYGDSQLGQFNLVAMTIFLPASLIGTAIGQVFYQRAAKQWADGEGFAPLWRQTASRLTLIGVPVYAAIAILSPWAYPFLFGAQWEPAGALAPWMALPALCAFVSTPLERSCLVTGRWKYQMGWHGARAVTTLAVVGIAHHLQLPLPTFMELLVVQMATLYLIDLGMEYRFAHLRPGL
ncbi:lipopolysaccharide biosynthesis protein [Roseateles sp. BYS87W]|uniref:Lipopolysaccharide biosynthesis protein n=1 Tax=Pelomonas baiyunensis TaxID=3299026 RepID=A0ABW7H3W1_9BURK